MTLTEVLDQLDIPRTGVVHVGAHRGQEVPDYRAAGFTNIVLVEPEPRLAQRLRDKFRDCTVIEKVVVASRAKTRRFNVASQRKWSSLLEIPPDQSITGLRIDTVDRITVEACRLVDIQDGCNVAVVDPQGTEPDVLAGADLLALDLVIVETVEPSEVFRPAWPRPDADAWFARFGWYAVHEFGHTAPDVCDVAYAPADDPEPEPESEPAAVEHSPFFED